MLLIKSRLHYRDNKLLKALIRRAHFHPHAQVKHLQSEAICFLSFPALTAITHLFWLVWKIQGQVLRGSHEKGAAVPGPNDTVSRPLHGWGHVGAASSTSTDRFKPFCLMVRELQKQFSKKMPKVTLSEDYLQNLPTACIFNEKKKKSIFTWWKYQVSGQINKLERLENLSAELHGSRLVYNYGQVWKLLTRF